MKKRWMVLIGVLLILSVCFWGVTRLQARNLPEENVIPQTEIPQTEAPQASGTKDTTPDADPENHPQFQTSVIQTPVFQVPALKSSAAVLMDFTTGEILYQKNGEERRAPASTTKILTSILAIEHGNLNQVLTSSAKAAKVGGSSIWLTPGEKHPLKELLYGVLLSSGNDASVTVAEGLAGSEAKFAEWMNRKAIALGATSSHFVNCNGLPAANHYTTAHDLALITRYALKNPLFAAIVKTKKKVIDWPGHKWDRLMVNHNKLLWNYRYADGVKTGYTLEAGKCLVSSATKNGHRLIAVVMNSKDMYRDSEALFDYGFANYQLLTVATSHEKIAAVNVDNGVKEEVPVLPNRTLTMVLPNGATDHLQIVVKVPSQITAPVDKNQPLGELEVKLGEHLVEKVPVVAAYDVARESVWHQIWSWVIGAVGLGGEQDMKRQSFSSTGRLDG